MTQDDNTRTRTADRGCQGPADIAAQRDRLRRRVAASRLYLHEVDEFEIAVAAYSTAIDLCQVEQDLGTLTSPESRNLVRKVRLANGGLAALKVIGNAREPGEGQVLEAWWRHGLPCVQPLEHGDIRVGGHDAQYLLTAFLPLPTLRPAGEYGLAEKVGLVRELLPWLSRFHIGAGEVARTRTFEARAHLHLRWTLPLLRGHRLPEPAGWADELHRLSNGPRQVLIHGDVGGGNVLVGGEAGHVLLDPPGALRGSAEADVGQMCAHLGGPGDVQPLLQIVAEEGDGLDITITAFFAGVAFLTWAGYLLVPHHSPYVIRPASNDAVARAEDMLRLAGTLMSGWRADL